MSETLTRTQRLADAAARRAALVDRWTMGDEGAERMARRASHLLLAALAGLLLAALVTRWESPHHGA